MHQVINVLPSIHYNMEPIAVEDADGDISEHGYTLNREMDGMLVKFLHIFAQIRDMQYASFLPEVIVKIVYNFVGCPTENMLIESQETKDLMKHIWDRVIPIRADSPSKYRLDGKVTEDDLKAYLSNPNISILFCTKLIIRLQDMINISPGIFDMEVELFITKTGLYLISAENVSNYPIWRSFRDKTMIDKVINDNTQIDEAMAVKMARHFVYDDVIINNKVVPRLIGLTKENIWSNIVFTKAQIPSLGSLFGIRRHEDPVVRMIYDAAIRNDDDDVDRSRQQQNYDHVMSIFFEDRIYSKYFTEDWSTMSMFVDEWDTDCNVWLDFMNQDASCACYLKFINDGDVCRFTTLLRSLGVSDVYCLGTPESDESHLQILQNGLPCACSCVLFLTIIAAAVAVLLLLCVCTCLLYALNGIVCTNR
eukprot:892935_1